VSRHILEDAFAHHVWATLTLFDVCEGLDPEQLDAGAQGTYGSILDTMRHIVGSDASYLNVMSRGEVPRIDEETMSLAEVRAAMERHGDAWPKVLAGDPDPSEILVRRRDDGSETHAPFSIRLAQALHHGSDHRSQVCTVLTTIGVEPPEIDVWDYGRTLGSVTEVPPTG
jgi:uncharacterized damage-inducible protein DinB